MSRAKYQVFVSSTYRGLEEERRFVMQALLEMDCIPAGMELFPASSDEVWRLIESVITEVDYFVLIVGGRYGSTDESGVSYTEREYDLAVAKGIPILPFLHGDPAGIPAGLSEMEPPGRAKLTAFREKVEHAHHCKFWTTADGLSGAVSRSLNLMIRTNPRLGWVRGDMAKTVGDVERLGTLQDRVRELEGEVAAFERQVRDETQLFSRGTSIVPADAGIFNGTFDPAAISLTWDDVFVAAATATFTSPIEFTVMGAVQSLVDAKGRESQTAVPRLQHPHCREILRRQFLALGLIDVVTEQNPNGGYWTLWKLTPEGVKHLARLTAIKSPVPRDATAAGAANGHT